MTSPASTSHWIDRVDAPRPGARRRWLHEARVSFAAQRRVAADTSDMTAVFEVLENFPMADLLRATTARTRFVRSSSLRALYVDRAMPDLSNAALGELLARPAGSVGHEYARFLQGWGLDNAFGRNWEIDEPARYFAFRTAHLHDLFHFVTGYEPFEWSGEMEIEAFLYAQTGGPNHLVFIAGFMRMLRRRNPSELRRILPRLRAAHARGRVCANVMLVRWEDVLDRPLDEVRAELGLDDRPALPRERVRADRPSEIPHLAHVVINTPSLEHSTDFYQRIFGLEVTASDPRLGATFLSDGTDHHTLALGRSWGRGPRGWATGVRNDLPTLRALVAARRSGARSTQGRRPTLPPPAVVREHFRPGLNHLGYRVSSLEVLRAWYRYLRHEGIEVDWTVNHGDMILGLYFVDPNGVRFEIFCDGDRAKEALVELATHGLRPAGADTPRVGDFLNWDLDLDAAIGPELEGAPS